MFSLGTDILFTGSFTDAEDSMSDVTVSWVSSSEVVRSLRESRLSRDSSVFKQYIGSRSTHHFSECQ